MVLEGREYLRLGIIRNESGVMLVATIILLFFVSLFLFTIVLWHDSLYRNYDSLETYYENETLEIMKQDE